MLRNKKLALLRLTVIAWGVALALVCMGLSLPAEKKECLKEAQNHNTQTVACEQTYGLTDDELELIARVISAEARGESYDGQVAVGAVILNRVEHDDFPDTVTEVCYQPGAFSGVSDGQIAIEPSQSCRQAALDAAAGVDPTDGALYFYNPKTAVSEWIRSRPVVLIIGDHCFCV